ncbi:la-related protein 6 [Aplysia californica]|uniref:La-related protein 6 n=1 Tax=Aplysia californica TaxID=6500 RepID=A0ABM0JKB4_APLCA|nr:la-related protein 6 [Aplysia californica]
MSESTGITVPVVIEPVDSLDSSVVEDVSQQMGSTSLGSGVNGDEGPISGSEAPVVIVAPTLRVEQLKGNGSIHDSSFCTSEEEGFPPDFSDDGDGDHSGNNSSVPDLALDIDALIDPPDEEQQQKIISLVEYYFSDESILKDAFLLKHVRRNRSGFVSIKLITSFKKMKTLTKDYRIVAYSLKGSEKLELNDECTKVRRKDPLPDYDETVPSRTVVALNLPLENPTMENMAEIFSKCGSVANFRILRPGCSIPSDLHKFACKHPELGSTMCAVVAFEHYDQAKKACEILTNNEDWRKGMRVVPLMVPKRKEEKDKKDRKDKDKKDKKKAGGEYGEDDISPEEVSGDDKKRRKRGGRKKKTRVDQLCHDSSCYSSGSEGDSPAKPSITSPNRYRSSDHLSPHVTPPRGGRSSPVGSPHNKRRGPGKSPLVDSNSGVSPRSSPETVRRGIDSSGGDSTPSSPWVQRRLRVAQEKMSGSSPLGSPLLGRRNPDGTFIPGSAPRMLDMTNVLRQPKGPDDTKGFYGGIGRGKPRSSTFT